MKAGSWYICGFVVTFVYFYVYAINHIRGEIHGPPRRGHHPQPPYSRNNREEEAVIGHCSFVCSVFCRRSTVN